MDDIIEGLLGKRSRKEEQKILEERRQRKIRIGPDPKITKRIQNITSIMNDIYMERFMKGKDDSKFTNKLRDFRSNQQKNYNKNLSQSKKLDEDKNKDEENQFFQTSDFRNISFLKSSLIDETFTNNKTFLEKTKGIRDTIAHSKQVLGLPKKNVYIIQIQNVYLLKKTFQSNDQNIHESLRSSSDLNDRKKSKMQTIQERYQGMSDRNLSNSSMRQSTTKILNSPIELSSSRKSLTTNNFLYPTEIQYFQNNEKDIQFQGPSIALIKIDSQLERYRSRSELLSPSDHQDSQRERQKSLFHLEDSSQRKPNYTTMETQPTLLEIKIRELEKQEFEKQKQKLDKREQKVSSLKQKLGLIRQEERKKDIDVQIEKIQKEIDKIDDDISKCAPIGKFKLNFIRPLTFSLNKNYKKPIKPEQIKFKTENEDINLNTQTNEMNTNKILKSYTEEVNRDNNYLQFDNHNLIDSILQDDRTPNELIQTPFSGFRYKSTSTQRLSTNQSRSSKFLTIQIPVYDEQSGQTSNKDINFTQFQKRTSIQRNLTDKFKSNPLFLKTRQSSSRSVRGSIQINNLQYSPNQSGLSPVFFKESTIFGYSNQNQKKLQDSIQQAQKQLKKSHNKELSLKCSNLFSQVDNLQKETRQMAKEEIIYANEQSRIVKNNFSHWEVEFHEYNTEADKNLMKDIKYEIQQRDQQESMPIR